jgi:hypothetical protein
LEKSGLHSLRKRRHYLDAFFFVVVQVNRGLKPCTPRNLGEFSLFFAYPSYKHCPSARCAYAANVAVGKDLDIFAVGAVAIYAQNC